MTCQYILHYTLDYVLKTTSSITAKKTQDGKEKNKTQSKRKKPLFALPKIKIDSSEATTVFASTLLQHGSLHTSSIGSLPPCV